MSEGRQDAHFLNTSALLSTLGRMDIPVTLDMLRRWVRWEWLPKSESRGAGRGKGRKEYERDPSCVDRIRLIVGAESFHRKRIRRNAVVERALIAAGYWISGDRIRFHLHDLCTKMGKKVANRRPSMNKKAVDRDEAVSSLERSVKDRLSYRPEDVKSLHLCMTFGVASIDEGGDTPAVRISRSLSNQVMRDAIENVADADLERIYTEIGRCTHLGVVIPAQLRLFVGADRFPWLSHLTGNGDAFTAHCAALLWGILLQKHGPELHHDILQVIDHSMTLARGEYCETADQ